MSLTLRYAAHLGYAPPLFRPQFEATVGTGNLASHIEFAADHGFAGIFDPWVMERSATDQSEIRNALAETGLSFSSIVCTPTSELTAPLWVDRSAAGRQRIEQFVRQASTVATSMGGSLLVALVAGDENETDLERQLDNAAANLNAMGTIAGDHGLRLSIEPMTVLPNILTRNMAEAVDLVVRADQADVGILFDTGHASITDGDALRAYETVREHVVAIQVADMPGRVEPGAGRLQLVDVVVEAIRGGYDGVIDLEHQWAELSREGEMAGLQRIREFDEQVAHALRQDGP